MVCVFVLDNFVIFFQKKLLKNLHISKKSSTFASDFRFRLHVRLLYTIYMETYIIKRDGKKELFTIDKIKSAISKSFLAVGAFATDETLTGILSRLRIHNGISVEEIQNQVEVALMAEGYYQVAKAYMLYRQGHTVVWSS